MVYSSAAVASQTRVVVIHRLDYGSMMTLREIMTVSAGLRDGVVLGLISPGSADSIAADPFSYYPSTHSVNLTNPQESI